MAESRSQLTLGSGLCRLQAASGHHFLDAPHLIPRTDDELRSLIDAVNRDIENAPPPVGRQAASCFDKKGEGTALEGQAEVSLAILAAADVADHAVAFGQV